MTQPEAAKGSCKAAKGSCKAAKGSCKATEQAAEAAKGSCTGRWRVLICKKKEEEEEGQDYGRKKKSAFKLHFGDLSLLITFFFWYLPSANVFFSYFFAPALRAFPAKSPPTTLIML